jgi:hypothetical protein
MCCGLGPARATAARAVYRATRVPTGQFEKGAESPVRRAGAVAVCNAERKSYTDVKGSEGGGIRAFARASAYRRFRLPESALVGLVTGLGARYRLRSMARTRVRLPGLAKSGCFRVLSS